MSCVLCPLVTVGHQKPLEQLQLLELWRRAPFFSKGIWCFGPLGAAVANDPQHFQTLQWALVSCMEALALVLYFHKMYSGFFFLFDTCVLSLFCRNRIKTTQNTNTNAMRTCQMWSDQSGLLLKRSGMRGTTCKEQPQLCSVCTARQSSKQKRKLFTGGEFPSDFSPSFLLLLFFCGADGGGGLKSNKDVLLTTDDINASRAAESSPNWSLKIYFKCTLGHLSQPDISDAPISC